MIAIMPVELVNDRPGVVLERGERFWSVAELFIYPVGSRFRSIPATVEVEDQDDIDLECGVVTVTIRGRRDTARVYTYMIGRPGQSIWDAAEELGVDEESLLP